MTKDGHAVALLSGELSVEERIKVNKFSRLLQKTFSYYFSKFSLFISNFHAIGDGIEC